ncbi:MAG: PKD domain-containing protein, partial [Petrotogales bacterium]
VISNQSATTYDPGIMDFNTTYYWQIIAWDNQSAFNESPIWEFTVELEQNHPPYQPTNESPSNGSSGVPLNVVMSWTGGDPDGDPVTYDVYFGNITPPPKIVDNQTDTTYDPPGTLNISTTYYWQIIAWDNQSAFNESPIWEFTTGINHPPYQPTNESPSNGSTGVNINVDLGWTGGDPDNDTVTYDVYFGTDSNPPQVAVNISEEEYDPGPLNLSSTYYWRIVAWDDIGWFNESPIWKFRTAGNTPPYPPTITSAPDFGGPGIQLNFSAHTSDPEGHMIYYKFDWGDDNSTPWIGPFDTSVHVVANHSWNKSGEYEVTVKAKDELDAESGWSEPHNISITKLIEINNLKPGHIYFHIFTFTKSYIYIHLLNVLGITGLITTSGNLFINVTLFNEVVDAIKFEAYQILWNRTVTEWDKDMSDGANVLMTLPSGLFRVTAYAYDADNNMIDTSIVPYLFLFCRSKSGGG